MRMLDVPTFPIALKRVLQTAEICDMRAILVLKV